MLSDEWFTAYLRSVQIAGRKKSRALAEALPRPRDASLRIEREYEAESARLLKAIRNGGWIRFGAEEAQWTLCTHCAAKITRHHVRAQWTHESTKDARCLGRITRAECHPTFPRHESRNHAPNRDNENPQVPRLA